jgi:glycosyltransferase involved in cell wall biosynthesis
MKSSIIVLVRNKKDKIGQYITDLVKECKTKYGSEYEIIVIDNASTDGVRHDLFYDKRIVFIWNNTETSEEQAIAKANSYAIGKVKDVRRVR